MYQLGDLLRSLPEVQQNKIAYEMYVNFQTYRKGRPTSNVFLAEDILLLLNNLRSGEPECVTNIAKFVTPNLSIQTYFLKSMSSILSQLP